MNFIKWKGGLTFEDTKLLDIPEIKKRQENIEQIEAFHYWNKSKNIYRVTYRFPNGTKEVKEYKHGDYFA